MNLREMYGSCFGFVVFFLVVVGVLLPVRLVLAEDCVILRPNQNVNTLWDIYTYANIDDNVVAPNTPGLDRVRAYDTDAYSEQIWGFTNPAGSGITSVSEVNFHLYAGQWDVQDFHVKARLRIGSGGTWTGAQTVSLDSYAWKEVQFVGSWTVSDMDNLQLGLQAGDTESVYDAEVSVRALYCEICGPTSTPTPTPTATRTPTPTRTFTPTSAATATPLPTPAAIFQTADTDIYHTPSDDIDLRSASNEYTVYIYDVPENAAYKILRKTSTGSWSQISPSLTYDQWEIEGYYFVEPNTLSAAHYYYKVSSPGASASDELTDEAGAEVWRGGISLQ